MTNDETSNHSPLSAKEISEAREPSTATMLVKALVAAGLTPEEIAKRSGNRVSRRTIYRWIKGDVANPKQEQNLKALRRLLKRVERKNNDNETDT